MRCDRCGDEGNVSTMSFFNKDTICTPCRKDERDAPGFKAAHEAECKAVERGNYNFPGVGLSAEDRAFLARRLEDRQVDGNEEQG